MASPSPLKPSNLSSESTITTLEEDSLVECAAHLSLQDISNLAMSCKFLRRIAYNDSIWLRLFREDWPESVAPSLSQSYGMREAYLTRHAAVHQFAFRDPFLYTELTDDFKPFDHMIFDKKDLISSQGSSIEVTNIDGMFNRKSSGYFLTDHKARITCMRLFPLYEISFFRSAAQREENVLVTSSCDHTIRLWWKGSCQRCFRGHNGPVSTLSDKLLGDGNVKVLASGGEDGTVRLWSLSSSGKRGQHTSKATLYGHEKPVKLMSVAGHKTSILATISKDSKLRVWDTTASSAVRSSCCVGMTSVSGPPVGMKCHESLLYIAAGSSVWGIDLRTMQKVITAATCQPKLYSFAVLPSKSLICTGGNEKAMIWDIRRSYGTPKPEPVAELHGHCGPISLLHMDSYKIVTGGPEDFSVSVWDTDTGTRKTILTDSVVRIPDGTTTEAMAVDGTRIAIATNHLDQGFRVVSFRDFANATCPVLEFLHDIRPGVEQEKLGSKFWDRQSGSDDSDTELS